MIDVYENLCARVHDTRVFKRVVAHAREHENQLQ